MSRTEVTNGEYRKFQRDHNSKDYNGVSLNGDDQPVVYVSWDEAQSFMKWLMDQNGGQYKFRLPTEAEWEFACRSGSEASRYLGDDPNQACAYENVADLMGKNKWGWEDIHACDDSYVATAPVGRFQPNAYGLRDMLGNVAEWCEREFLEVIRYRPEYAEAHLNLGMVYTNLNRLEEAEKEHERSVALKPQSAEAHYNLGVFYELRRKDMERALAQYRRYRDLGGRDERVERIIGMGGP